MKQERLQVTDEYLKEYLREHYNYTTISTPTPKNSKSVTGDTIRKALAEAFAHGSNFSMYSEPSPDIVDTVYRKYFG